MSETKGKKVRIRDCDNYLPDCILVEILVRLPLKSVFKFKIVSKHWLSLISDPFFARRYETQINDRSPSKPWALVCFFLSHPWDFPFKKVGDYCIAVNEYPEFNSSGYSLSFLPIKFGYPYVEILASHNGLLLCCQKESYSYKSPVNFFVCNLLTKQHVSLPATPTSDCKCYWDAGFIGRDDGNYKVIRMRARRRLENMILLQILDSENGTWTELYLSLPPPTRWSYFSPGNVVTYNGILHLNVAPGKIIAYDPCRNNHQFRLIDLPTPQSGSGSLAVCGEHLCFFGRPAVAGNSSGTSFKMWVLADYKTGEWNLKRKIEYVDILVDDARSKRLLSSLVPKAVHPFNLDIVYLSCANSLFSLNFQTRKLVHVRSDLPHSVLAHTLVFSPWPIKIAQPCW